MSNENRREVAHLDLIETVPYGGVEGGMLKRLCFCNPRGKTLRRLQSTDDPGGQAMVLIYDLTGVPIAVLDLLDFEDAILASALAGEILAKKLCAAAVRGKALGIEVPSPEEQGLTPGEVPSSEGLGQVEAATEMQLEADG